MQNFNEKNDKILAFLSNNSNCKLINNNQIKNFKFTLFKFFFLLKYFDRGKYYSKYRFWKFLWNENFYLSSRFIKKISISNNVKTLTILEDLPLKKFLSKIFQKN